MSKYSKEWPSDTSTQNALVKAMDEVADAMLEIQGANELIKTVKEDVQEKYGFDGATFMNYAKLKFDIIYNEGKKAEKIREQSDVVDIVEGFT